MPRPPRVTPAGYPLHIVQRGNDRQACFLCSRDYYSYLRALEKYSRTYGIDIHAYVLMTNHVHLLVTPKSDSSASKLMQQVGRAYVSYFNKLHGRSGTLWEGRFRSSLIDTDRYLLACYRYIELNPVRASIVTDPALYRWSSYGSNALGMPSKLITPHELWIGLGGTTENRCQAYRRLFSEEVDERAIRHAFRKGIPLGSGKWCRTLESDLGILFSASKRGRPRKAKKGV